MSPSSPPWGTSYGPQPDRGIYRTTDGGETWEKVLFVDENTGAVDIVMDPSNPRILFAATWQLVIRTWGRESGGPGSGIYMSRDGGSTWTRLTGRGLPDSPLGRIGLAMAPSDPNRVYALIEAGIGKGVLWRSDNKGRRLDARQQRPDIESPPALLLTHGGPARQRQRGLLPHAAAIDPSLDGGGRRNR